MTIFPRMDRRSVHHLCETCAAGIQSVSLACVTGPLEDFVKTLPVPVKIVRQGYRSGLMRARVAGNIR